MGSQGLHPSRPLKKAPCIEPEAGASLCLKGRKGQIRVNKGHKGQ